MVATTIPCSFERDSVWNKVRDRIPVVLDMNCWIDMGDDKSILATRIKETLRKRVSDGLIFCPLSWGLICELYKQSESSRLQVGSLMDELSLSISYAPRNEIFDWEIEKA